MTVHQLLARALLKVPVSGKLKMRDREKVDTNDDGFVKSPDLDF